MPTRARTTSAVPTASFVSAHGIVGVFCGFAALVLSARPNSVEVAAGIGHEPTVISAAGDRRHPLVGSIGLPAIAAALIVVLVNSPVLNNFS